MKKERNARKKLIELYMYFDMQCNYNNSKTPAEIKQKYDYIKGKYDKIYKNCKIECITKYYGLFYLSGNRIGIDPKRMNKMLSKPFKQSQINIMNDRNTTFFYPYKKSYLDYIVNNFVSVTQELKNEFEKVYVPIIEQVLSKINDKRKTINTGDINSYIEGIADFDEASASATLATIYLNNSVDKEICDIYITLMSNFFHNMASRIEGVSKLMYKKIDPKTKWNRARLYNYKSTNYKTVRNLSSFEFHDKLYLIWNFLKHNDGNTYKKIKNRYPEILTDGIFEPNRPAKYYIKITYQLIMDLLNGVEEFFIEWCRINCNENYDIAQWNYDDYFKNLVNKKIKENENLFFI